MPWSINQYIEIYLPKKMASVTDVVSTEHMVLLAVCVCALLVCPCLRCCLCVFPRCVGSQLSSIGKPTFSQSAVALALAISAFGVVIAVCADLLDTAVDSIRELLAHPRLVAAQLRLITSGVCADAAANAADAAAAYSADLPDIEVDAHLGIIAPGLAVLFSGILTLILWWQRSADGEYADIAWRVGAVAVVVGLMCMLCMVQYIALLVGLEYGCDQLSTFRRDNPTLFRLDELRSHPFLSELSVCEPLPTIVVDTIDLWVRLDADLQQVCDEAPSLLWAATICTVVLMLVLSFPCR